MSELDSIVYFRVNKVGHDLHKLFSPLLTHRVEQVGYDTRQMIYKQISFTNNLLVTIGETVRESCRE